jgi:ubiquitin carboxyl-terminal hydrolase L5
MLILSGRHTTRSLGLLSSTMILGCPLNQTYCRPADTRGATNALAVKTLDDVARAERSTKPPPAKRRKLVPKRKKPVNPEADPNQEEAYHFIGYVPFRGKVWELDGLKSKPVEVGELSTSPSSSGPETTVNQNWMDIVRPVLRMKMRMHGGGDDENGSIKFNLLAIVRDQFCKVSDQLELLRRERAFLEKHLDKTYPEGWCDKASCLSLLPITSCVADVFRSLPGRPYVAE